MSKKLCMSDNEFEMLLGKYQYSFVRGDLVKGIVVGYSPDGVLVHIGSKNDALVPLQEACLNSNEKPEDTLICGQEYEFLIIREEDENSRFLLSYKKVAQAYIWKELEELKKNGAIVAGTICNIIKGGLLVDVAGLKGFVPLSHLGLKENEIVVGNEIALKILTVDSNTNNFVLSNKKLQTELQGKNKKEAFETFEVGQIREGEVVRITDFGAFVDVDGIDGLLPLSQISWKWVEHPKDLLQVGQKLQVEIMSLDYEKMRVSLSHKSLKADPWLNAESQLAESKQVQGFVTRLKLFGAFVVILEGVEALLPISELNDYQQKKHMVIEEGTQLLVTITKMNIAARRIRLSVKDT